jgi:hypothetical protein
MWIPMMLFSGIMDMMFFTSMMSFMGLAMNPFESAMVGGSDSYYHDTSGGGDDTNSADDQAGTSGGNDDVSNSGDFDSGGGFDSF